MDKVPSVSSMTRLYSKSGCRTCKIRRVKCDKDRPSCRRCISTGRTCDGYGIWGDESAVAKVTHHLQQRSLYDLSTRSRVGPRTQLERETFDWFRYRASVKLCGVFSSHFWDTLVLQGSLAEPAILHALLALGSAHRTEMMRSSRQETDTKSRESEQQERFTLEQYNKAIVCLRPHFAKTDRDASSTRMVLITCAIFVCLELLQGRLREGQTHLQNGMKLLCQIQTELHPGDARGLVGKNHPQTTVNDGYLTETFSRLYAHSFLFGWQVTERDFSPRCISASSISDPVIQTPPPLFRSTTQARQYLDDLFDAIHCLTIQAMQLPRECKAQKPPAELFDRQGRILTSLRLWQHVYKVSRRNLTSQLNVRDVLSYPLLTVYHTMAVVMATTCLVPPDESIFDSFEASFASVVAASEEILKEAVAAIVTDEAAGYCSSRFSFTADLGLIPPLYYTALKCRVSSLRHRAVRLLETVTHRESVWDGAVAARIAREVFKIEEEQVSLPCNTQCRVRRVSVNFSPGLATNAILTCEKRESDGEWTLTDKVVSLQ